MNPRSTRPRLEELESREVPAQVGVRLLSFPTGETGSDVVAKNADGTTRYTYSPVPGFKGIINVATADLNGDGTDDIVVGAGPGGGGAPHIRVESGTSGGGELLSFFAFDPKFLGGVSVATGDIDRDGVPDIIVGAGPGGGPHVKVFSGANGAEIRSFFAFAATNTDGVNVASGDLDRDGHDDIIVGSSTVTSQVKVFDGSTLAVEQQFLAYTVVTNGVFVAVSNIAGVDTLITGNGPGDPPFVKVYRANGNIDTFVPYPTDFFGGVSVAGTADGKILTGAGPGGGPHVEVFDGVYDGLSFKTLESYFALDAKFTGGVIVG